MLPFFLFFIFTSSVGKARLTLPKEEWLLLEGSITRAQLISFADCVGDIILSLPSICCYLYDMTGEGVTLVIGHNLLPDELIHDVRKVGQDEGQHLE